MHNRTETTGRCEPVVEEEEEGAKQDETGTMVDSTVVRNRQW